MPGSGRPTRQLRLATSAGEHAGRTQGEVTEDVSRISGLGSELGFYASNYLLAFWASARGAVA